MIQNIKLSVNQETLYKGLAVVGLSLVLCLTMIQVIRLFTGDYSVPSVSLNISVPDQAEIKHEALFGTYEGADKPLQETALNLQLMAVFASQDPLKGSAVISASGRKPLLHIVGDNLPGGVIIKEVHQDYVVLEQAGEQSILPLPKKRL